MNHSKPSLTFRATRIKVIQRHQNSQTKFEAVWQHACIAYPVLYATPKPTNQPMKHFRTELSKANAHHILQTSHTVTQTTLSHSSP